MALTASATLAPLNRGFNVKQWSMLFPGFSRRRRGTLFSFPKNNNYCRRKGFGVEVLKFVSSSAMGPNGVAAEIYEPPTSPPRFYSWRDNKRPRVCILGGGFGGLYTALRLESLVWPDEKRPQVLLVDQSEHFVFKPMLYELLSGEVDEWEIAPRFTDLLASTSVLFFQDKVKSLHPYNHLGRNRPASSTCGGTIHLESGLLIEYDWLVLALGAETKLDLVPGAAEFALPFSTLEDARRVDNELRTLERRNFGKNSLIRVAVVGCGFSGVELAATISERLQDKGTVQAINVEKTICPQAPPGNREAALRVLSTRKVQLLLGYLVRSVRRAGNAEFSVKPVEDEVVEEISTETDSEYILELQPAERGLKSQIHEADLVLWTVGSRPLLPQLERCDRPHELPLNAQGQVETDETLRVKGHPRIFALGDSSTLRDSDGRALPGTAQVAFQQADFAGWNLWAAINDRPLLPFRFQNLGEMMTLGRNDAALSPTFIEGLTIEGPIGHTGKSSQFTPYFPFLVVRLSMSTANPFIFLLVARKIAYLIRLPTDEHRLKVGISWLTKTAIDSIASVQSTLSKVLSTS